MAGFSFFIETIMADKIWKIKKGGGHIIAAAIHDGHEIRDGLKAIVHISEQDRLREEDPFTGTWTEIAATRIVGLRSRFEVDLNRPREKAVYRIPEDAWNLNVWKTELPENEVIHSLSEYDSFYDEVYKVLSEIESRYGHFVVFDLHSYNHMRNGPDGSPADTELNPEVNIGTGTMDRQYWAPVVESFMKDLHHFDYFDRQLDVRENVKFKGGNFSQWIHKNFPKTGCALAIEFKKFFMNEWTGEPDHEQVKTITLALKSTIPGILKELKNY